MTRKQFERLAQQIQKEKFECVIADPLQFALQRAQFRQSQIKRLITAGRTVKGSRTVTSKVARYERSLVRMQAVPSRIRKLMSQPTRQAQSNQLKQATMDAELFRADK